MRSSSQDEHDSGSDWRKYLKLENEERGSGQMGVGGVGDVADGFSRRASVIRRDTVATDWDAMTLSDRMSKGGNERRHSDSGGATLDRRMTSSPSRDTKAATSSDEMWIGSSPPKTDLHNDRSAWLVFTL